MSKTNSSEAIDTGSFLVLSGASKSDIRTWLKNRWIYRLNGHQGRLDKEDTFSRDSLSVRLPFIMAVNGSTPPDLATIFIDEFGDKDARLLKELDNTSPEEIIQEIGKKYQLPYDLRRVNNFRRK